MSEYSGGMTMTRTRYIVVAGLLALLVGAGLGVSLILSPSRGFTESDLERIQGGMTLMEVERILGGPGEKGEFGFSNKEIYVWRGGRSQIDVVFDIKDGRVTDKTMSYRDSSETIPETIDFTGADLEHIHDGM